VYDPKISCDCKQTQSTLVRPLNWLSGPKNSDHRLYLLLRLVTSLGKRKRGETWITQEDEFATKKEKATEKKPATTQSIGFVWLEIVLISDLILVHNLISINPHLFHILIIFGQACA
jgi:ABC-type polar amino acid transport system ATPase subunit